MLSAAESDAVVVNQFGRVTSLVDPATRLLRPKFVWRMARANYRSRRRAIAQDEGHIEGHIAFADATP